MYGLILLFIAFDTVSLYTHPSYGNILTDNRGITLYTSKDDKFNESTCYDLCLFNFRPYTVSEGQVKAPEGFVGNLATTRRKDNQRQVVFNGRPLYTFIEDKIPGDVNGQGFNNQWFIVNFYTEE